MFWSGTAGSKVTGLHGAVCSGTAGSKVTGLHGAVCSGTAGSKVTGLHGAVCSGVVLLAVKLRDCTEPYVLVWY